MFKRILIPAFLGLILSVFVLMSGCGSNPPTASGGTGGGGGTTTSSGVQIYGNLVAAPSGLSMPGGINAWVTVAASTGVMINNASVNINATPISFNPAKSQYEGIITMTPGATYTLTVTIPGDAHTYTATGTMFTTYPSGITPASGTTLNPAVANTVNWLQGGPTAGAINWVGVMNASMTPIYPAPSPGGGGGPLSITLATTHSIPAGSMTVNTSTPAILIVGIGKQISIINASGSLSISGFAANSVTIVPSSTTPTITGFTPASGTVGTSVTITGTNFSATPANNTVTFNGTGAVVSAATATSLTVTVPAGATTGTISVTVGGQTATSAGSFTVIPPAPAAPTGVVAAASNARNAISWNPAATATSYNIYWMANAPVGTTAAQIQAGGTKITGAVSPYLHTVLTNNTTYSYVVTSVNTGGESVPSAIVTATPNTISISAEAYYFPGLALPKTVSVWVGNSTGAININNATVTVNGVNIPQVPATPGLYEASTAISANTPYTLMVTIPGDTNIYTATGTMFATVNTITSPAANFVWASTSVNTATWTNPATIAGDENIIAIMDGFGVQRYPATPGTGVVVIPLNTTYQFLANSIAAGANPSMLMIGTSRPVDITNAGGVNNKFQLKAGSFVSGTIN